MTNRQLRVLVLGATGVFGSRLVERLAGEAGIDLILAARDPLKLDALRARTCPAAEVRPLDRQRVGPSDLAGADVVVDAAGPFQGSDYGVIEAALAAGVHYLDLADGRDFVGGLAGFDEAAKRVGVSVISGASSVPALSHAVIDRLTTGWRSIEAIKVGIFPGNRAPRGLSVVEAILSYAGQPVRVFREGRWQMMPGWGGTHRWLVAGLGKRWASVCDTPDQDLLVQRYRPTRAAEFFAGVELSVMHLGLALLSLSVRWKLIATLRPCARLLHRMADWLVAFGDDVGAMEVRVTGVDEHGERVLAGWTLIARGNCGPSVPTLAAIALLRRLRNGMALPVGASPCVGILNLADFAQDFDALGIERRIWARAPAA